MKRTLTSITIVVAALLIALVGYLLVLNPTATPPPAAPIAEVQVPKIVVPPKVEATRPRSAVVRWETDVPCDSYVRLSDSADGFDRLALDPKLAQKHELVLGDLSPSTTYRYIVESTDDGGAVVLSKEGYFETPPAYDVEKPTVAFSLPEEDMRKQKFKVDASDNLGVARVEFLIDNEYAFTDYSAPYEMPVDAMKALMKRGDFFREHQLEVKAWDYAHRTAATMGTYLPLSTIPIVDITAPYPEFTIWTDGETAPLGTWVYFSIEARESAWRTQEEVRNYERVIIESADPVESLEMRIDGDLVLQESPTGEQTRFTYDWFASGIHLGDHEVEVIAISHDGGVATTQRMIPVVQRQPTLEVRRIVEHEGTYVRVRLRITNRLDPSDPSQVAEISSIIYSSDHSRLQPVEKSNDAYTVSTSHDVSLRRSSVEIQLNHPQRLDPGDFFEVEYLAVPVLFDTDDPIWIGEGTTFLGYTDPFGHIYDDTYTHPIIDNDSFQTRIEDAISKAYYLAIVSARTDRNSLAEFSRLLSLSAELALLRGGILGYPSFNVNTENEYHDLIMDWGGRLSGSDGMLGGFLSNGYLLLVGEAEVIGTCTYHVSGQEIRWSDLCIADTNGHIDPELTVGRIIGDDANELAIPLEATINVIKGEPNYEFDRSRALTVAGDGDGVDAFEESVDDVSDILRTEFDSVRELKVRDILAGGNDSTTEFKANDNNRDVVYYRNHCSPRAWVTGDPPGVTVVGITDFVGANPVSFGDSKPVAFACCCSAGLYENVGGGGIAEAFVGVETAGYIGATRSSNRDTNNAACRWFFEHWVGSTDPAAKVLRDLKVHLSDTTGDRWSAKYNYYGDPMYAGTKASFSPETLMRSKEVQEPDEKLEVIVPEYILRKGGTKHRVEHSVRIPNGGMRIEIGKPLVPTYSVSVEYPRGYEVQSVALTGIADPEVKGDIWIPNAVPDVDVTSKIDRVKSGPIQSAWWPDDRFDWSVQRDPVHGTSTLTIRAFPISYNSDTDELRFYRTFQFHIDTIKSPLALTVAQLESSIVDTGENVAIDMYLVNADKPIDTIVKVLVKSMTTEEVVTGLPLRMLREVKGLASFGTTMETSQIRSGQYRIEISLVDKKGRTLATRTVPLVIAPPKLEISGLTVKRSDDRTEAELNIWMEVENTGSESADGTLVIEVRGPDGKRVVDFEEPFDALVAGKTSALHVRWQPPKSAQWEYEIIGYVLFDGHASDSRRVSTLPDRMGKSIQ